MCVSVCVAERECEGNAEALCACRRVSLHDYLVDVCVVVAVLCVQACVNVLLESVCVHALVCSYLCVCVCARASAAC